MCALGNNERNWTIIRSSDEVELKVKLVRAANLSSNVDIAGWTPYTGSGSHRYGICISINAESEALAIYLYYWYSCTCILWSPRKEKYIHDKTPTLECVFNDTILSCYIIFIIQNRTAYFMFSILLHTSSLLYWQTIPTQYSSGNQIKPSPLVRGTRLRANQTRVVMMCTVFHFCSIPVMLLLLTANILLRRMDSFAVNLRFQALFQ